MIGRSRKESVVTMARIATLLAFVSVLAFCQAVPVLIPSGKEMKYSYRAEINVGTYEPTPFASKFILDAKMLIQKLDEKHVAMKMIDITYKLYNGELSHHYNEKELQPIALPEEMKSLTLPFVMVYNENGNIEKVIMNKNDHKSSRDMKKGIASLMQLDMKQIKLDSKKGYAFTSQENSVYDDHVNAMYHVVPEDDYIMVDKMLDIETDARNWYEYFGTTDFEVLPEMFERDPMTVGAHRKYTIINIDSHLITDITSQGSTYLALMAGKSDTQFMLVNQELSWQSTEPIQVAMTKPEHELVEDLKFTIEHKEDAETFVDLTFGRNTMNYQEFIMNVLKETVEHMKMRHLNMESLNLKLGQWTNRLYRVMGTLDLKTLEHMYATMEEKTDEKEKEMFELFQEMLPQIGTRASVLFMRNLIRKQKVSDEIAMTMLIQMPSNLRMPSEKLLVDLEDMMHLDKVNTTIQKTAVLTFASMINKVFVDKARGVDEHIKSDLLEKYILKFMDLLKNANDYSTQFLYMSALYNIRTEHVHKYLKPYVTGEVTKNHNIRSLAIWASEGKVTAHPKEVFETYWPIFADPAENLELRIGAYWIIMSTKPCRAKLLNIYHVLKNDPCPDLYHMHWTFLRSKEYSTKIIDQEYTEMISQMLNFMRKPMYHTLTGYYTMDYMDPNYGFTSMMNAAFISTNTSQSVFLDIASDHYNFPLSSWALWLKIDGMDASVTRKIPVNFEKIKSNHMLEELFRMIMSLKEQKNIHVEYAILKNNKIIMMDFADHSTLDKLKVDLDIILGSQKVEIEYQQAIQVIMPNDLGLPTVFEYLMPSVSYHEFENTGESLESPNVKLGDWKFWGTSHATYGLAFYNPMGDIWQGVKRIQANEVITRMNFRVAMTKDLKLKLTVENQDDDTMDKFAIRTYTTNVVFIVKDHNNHLQKSSKDSPHYAKVSKGKDYGQTKTVFKHDCPHTGLMYEIGIFDSEHHTSRRTTMELLKDFTQRYSKNYQTMPFGHAILSMSNMLDYMFLSPQIGTSGLTIRAIPSKKYPVNHIDITLAASMDLIKEKENHLPNTKINTKFSWTTNTKDNTMLHSWDTNAILDMDPGRTLNNFKIHYSSNAPNEKEFKMCVVGMRKWINNKMVGHMNVTMGHTDSETCVDNEGLIEIDMKGELSDEQQNMINKKLTYDECLPVHMHEPMMKSYKVDYEENVDCTMKHTSMRKFEYDIKTTGMSEKCKDMIKHVAECVRGWLTPFYSNEKTNTAMDDHSMKVIIDYPVSGHEMNMEIITPKTTHIIKEAPNAMVRWMGFKPESYHYSSMATWMHKIGMTKSCLIADLHIFNDNHQVSKIHDKEWIMMAQTNPDLQSEHTMKVFVKQMEGHKAMGLRVQVDGDKTLEILPEGETYNIIWENKPLTLTSGKYLDEKIFSIGMLHDRHNTVIIHMYNFGVYIDYDGEQIRMDKPKFDTHFIGECFTE